MKQLTTHLPEPRAERFATQLLHDEANTRIVGFHLSPGQSVPPHASPSTVLLMVVEGSGVFHGEEGEVRLAAGQSVVYAPGERHAIEAGDESLRFLAVLTPRPS